MNDYQTSTQVLTGGSVRVSHGIDSGPSEFGPPDSCRVYSGAVRSVGGSMGEHHGGSVKDVASSDGVQGGSVIATLARGGTNQTVELVPGIPGSRTDIEAAVRAGVLIRDRYGNLQDAPHAATAIAAEALQSSSIQSEGAPDVDFDVFNQAEEVAWAEDLAPLPQHSYDSAVASVVGAVVQGADNFDSIASRLAESSGIEPALAAEYVEQGIAFHERMVARALDKMGIGEGRKEEAYAFFREHPGKLQEAIQRLTHARDMSGFRDLAVQFKVNYPGDLSAYRSAGFETHVDRATGDLLVRPPGGGWQRLSDLQAVMAQPQQPAAARPSQVAKPRMVVCPASGNLIPESALLVN